MFEFSLKIKFAATEKRLEIETTTLNTSTKNKERKTYRKLSRPVNLLGKNMNRNFESYIENKGAREI